MNDTTPQRPRGSLLEAPWYIAVAVFRMLSRQLDEQRVRRLER